MFRPSTFRASPIFKRLRYLPPVSRRTDGNSTPRRCCRAANPGTPFPEGGWQLQADNGSVIRELPAVSGAPGSTPADQKVRNFGTIPEGDFTVDPKKIDDCFR